MRRGALHLAWLILLLSLEGGCSTVTVRNPPASTESLNEEKPGSDHLLSWIVSTYAHEEPIRITVESAASFFTKDITVIAVEDGVSVQLDRSKLPASMYPIALLWKSVFAVDLPIGWQCEFSGRHILLGSNAASPIEVVIAEVAQGQHISLFAVSASASLWENDVWLVIVSRSDGGHKVLGAKYLD